MIPGHYDGVLPATAADLALLEKLAPKIEEELKGEFVWHHHEAEDELFLVVKGSLLIKLRDRDLRVEEGEFVIIPRGVEHLPIAKEEVHVLLLEPKSTLNTGNVANERTVAELDRL